MADQAPEKKDVVASIENDQEVATTETKTKEENIEGETTETANQATETTEKPVDETAEKKAETEQSSEAPATTKDSAVAPKTPTTKDTSRRKSGAASTGKTLNKKGSKARMLNIDAKPGDHFLVKLKGFPAWPAVICDEEMLPEPLLKSRPVTAARSDGTYTDNYADGGKRVYDRTFPVMYLYTNEFGWVVNTALTELPPDKARESITEKTRKDLKAALELAIEHNPIEHYKTMLKAFMDEAEAAERAKKEAAATPKKPKKGKGKDDDDTAMDDAEEVTKSSKSKKRKADADIATPQRSDSAKKPKIKLNTSSTPKATNGTPKAESAAKSAKNKNAAAEKKEPKEAKMTAEDRHKRKEKEVLYLRHKLQRGLLTRDQKPQETEMKHMSEFVTLLENFSDLEVSIIRVTKINKVLKAILKLDTIPREEEFKFKERSQKLLDKWNKLMSEDSSGATNGVNGSDGKEEEEKKKPTANGVVNGAGAIKAEETTEENKETEEAVNINDAEEAQKAKSAEEPPAPVAAEA